MSPLHSLEVRKKRNEIHTSTITNNFSFCFACFNSIYVMDGTMTSNIPKVFKRRSRFYGSVCPYVGKSGSNAKHLRIYMKL